MSKNMFFFKNAQKCFISPTVLPHPPSETSTLQHDGSDDDVIVVGQLGKLSSFQDILVKLVVIHYWENNLKEINNSI